MEPKILSVPAETSNIPRQSVGKTLFEKITSCDEDSVAMVDAKSGLTCTYGQLASESINMAQSLRHLLKITKNTNLAIVSENSHKFCVALLASLYLAAPIHLLNPGYTTYELEKFLMMSKPKLVFCTKRSLSNILALKKQCPFVHFVVLLDDDDDHDVIFYRDLIKNQNCYFEFENIDVDDQVAYIANSSGTTGFPKGVMITHQTMRMILSHSENDETCPVEDLRVLSNVVPFYHAYGCSLCWGGFYQRYKIVFMDQFVPTIFLESIQKYKIRTLCIVPTLGDFLANSPLLDDYDLSSVDNIFSTTGILKMDTQEKILKKFKISCVRQCYGLTEVGVAATLTPAAAPRPKSCGKLSPGVSAKIVDPNTSELLGCNQPGEIRLKGAAMKGYVNDPEQTRLAFDSDGFVRTGDTGYYDEDGYFYIIDRYKDLIKYKSLQVAPAEIEDILLKHPKIKDAAVVGKPDDRYGELPVAFVVREGDLEEGEVVEHVAKHVCVEKRLHGGVRFVGEIPRNSVGKVLRKDLRNLLK